MRTIILSLLLTGCVGHVSSPVADGNTNSDIVVLESGSLSPGWPYLLLQDKVSGRRILHCDKAMILLPEKEEAPK